MRTLLRRIAILLCLPFALALYLPAADNYEASVGYMHLTPGKDGFNVAGGYSPVKHLVLEGDIGAYFKTHDNTSTYLFGPKASLTTRDGIFTGFAHILFGAAHENNTYFAYLAGVGLDVGKHKLAFRPEADIVRFNGGTHGRVGIGVVYRW